MKKAYLVILGILVVFLAMGCGSKPPEVKGDPNIPDFVLNPPLDDTYMYGVGSALFSNQSQAMQAADARARTDLANKLKTEVQAMIIDYSRTAGTENNQTSALTFYESVSRQLTETTLTKVDVVERKRTPDGTWWTLMRMSKADAAQSAADVITSEASRYAEFKAMEALKMMEQQLNK